MLQSLQEFDVFDLPPAAEEVPPVEYDGGPLREGILDHDNLIPGRCHGKHGAQKPCYKKAGRRAGARAKRQAIRAGHDD